MNFFRKLSISLALIVLAPLVTVIPARAETIEFVATDLADVILGEDLWQYAYTVSGHIFLLSEFFDIYFDPSLYGNLTAGPAPNADWDVVILQQPDPVNFPPFDQGIFDSFALSDNASLSDTFLVNFVFLGSGTPGAQHFEIFDANFPSGLVASGLTSVPGTAVPEPSTTVLFLSALIACAIPYHRRHKLRRRVS